MRVAWRRWGWSSGSPLTGWMPVFFIDGQGGTLLRSLVVSAAVALFLLTAGLLWQANRRTRVAIPLLVCAGPGSAGSRSGRVHRDCRDGLSPAMGRAVHAGPRHGLYVRGGAGLGCAKAVPREFPLAAVEDAWRENAFLAQSPAADALGVGGCATAWRSWRWRQGLGCGWR